MKKYKRFTKKIDSAFVSELDCRIAYNKLCAIENKIERRKMIELPFKLGARVYSVFEYGKNVYEVIEGYISYIWLRGDGEITYEVVSETGSIDTEEGTLLSNGYYLTKASAKKKLKEFQNENKERRILESSKKCYWVVFHLGWKIIEYDIMQIAYNIEKTKIRHVHCKGGGHYKYFDNRDFGKDVFLTRAEAEAKLKELQNER